MPVSVLGFDPENTDNELEPGDLTLATRTGLCPMDSSFLEASEGYDCICGR